MVMNNITDHKTSRFILVGGTGFLVDSACFTLCVYGLDLALNDSRIISFLLAAFTTWLGNRYFTFAQGTHRKASQQWCLHLLVASLSFGFNYLCFQWLLGLQVHVALAFVAGVAVGTLSNYGLSSRWVFSAQPG